MSATETRYTAAINEGDSSTGTHEESHGTRAAIEEIYQKKWPGFCLVEGSDGVLRAFKSKADSRSKANAIGECRALNS